MSLPLKKNVQASARSCRQHAPELRSATPSGRHLSAHATTWSRSTTNSGWGCKGLLMSAPETPKLSSKCCWRATWPKAAKERNPESFVGTCPCWRHKAAKFSLKRPVPAPKAKHQQPPLIAGQHLSQFSCEGCRPLETTAGGQHLCLSWLARA